MQQKRVDFSRIRKPKYKKVLLKTRKRVRHLEFPGGLPSKYYPGPTVLDLADLTGCRIFTVVWSYPPSLRT